MLERYANDVTFTSNVGYYGIKRKRIEIYTIYGLVKSCTERARVTAILLAFLSLELLQVKILTICERSCFITFTAMKDMIRRKRKKNKLLQQQSERDILNI